MSRRVVAMVVASTCLLTGVASADVQRLYVLDCGRNVGKDQARWSPGVNEGKPIEFSDNCYLIRHDRGLLLWTPACRTRWRRCPTGWSWPTARSPTGAPGRSRAS